MAFGYKSNLLLKTSVDLFLPVFAISFMSALALGLRVDDSIRLYGGSPNSSEGFVQVKVSGVWKAICYDGWDVVDALVACRQLGFTEGLALLWRNNDHWSDATEPPSDGFPIKGSNFLCVGDEESLLSCNYTKDENTFCSTRAGVACGVTAAKYSKLLTTVNPLWRRNHIDYFVTTSSRIVSAFRGTYNLYEHTLISGGICDMDEQAARLICSDLGYTIGGQKTKSFVPEGLPMMVSRMTCGFESYVANCDLQYTPTGVCPDGVLYNAIACYRGIHPSVFGALVFAAVSSIVILIAGACGVRRIRKDRKIPDVIPEDESADDFRLDHSEAEV